MYAGCRPAGENDKTRKTGVKLGGGRVGGLRSCRPLRWNGMMVTEGVLMGGLRRRRETKRGKMASKSSTVEGGGAHRESVECKRTGAWRGELNW